MGGASTDSGALLPLSPVRQSLWLPLRVGESEAGSKGYLWSYALFVQITPFKVSLTPMFYFRMETVLYVLWTSLDFVISVGMCRAAFRQLQIFIL